ncbi:general stress protein CsbD [Aureimonas ureilytica]|uniref:General stress protein CsbD n=1 Tax=Aureimonas ureilytica TaxID=401562 RepID=A0A175R8X5_9HYPH|nr:MULTISPECIES: CsbD family protein [Aureimonas]KTQ95811.1 general stress protein CsbD [Aureimonas ureilytica]
MVDKNEISGGAKELGGKVKEGLGKLVGNDRLQAEGLADQAEGKTEKNYGKVKDAVKDTLGSKH